MVGENIKLKHKNDIPEEKPASFASPLEVWRLLCRFISFFLALTMVLGVSMILVVFFDRTSGGWAVFLSLELIAPRSCFRFVLCSWSSSMNCPWSFVPQGKLGRRRCCRTRQRVKVFFCPQGFVPQGKLLVVPRGFVPQGNLVRRQCCRTRPVQRHA